jgi:hypothetical protein
VQALEPVQAQAQEREPEQVQERELVLVRERGGAEPGPGTGRSYYATPVEEGYRPWALDFTPDDADAGGAWPVATGRNREMVAGYQSGGNERGIGGIAAEASRPRTQRSGRLVDLACVPRVFCNRLRP